MKINFNVSFDKTRNPDVLSNQQILLNWALYGAKKKYPDGLKGIMLRTAGSVFEKIEENITKDEIELETAEKDFVKSIFADDVAFPPESGKFIIRVQEEIESWKK